jgi:hypothetical protein
MQKSINESRKSTLEHTGIWIQNQSGLYTRIHSCDDSLA